jgi:hypothetical protein
VRQFTQNTARSISVYVGDTGLTLTVVISKAGGAFSAIAGAVSELMLGWYRIVLADSDVDTIGDLAFHCTDPTYSDPVAVWVDEVVTDSAALLAVKAKTDLIPAAGPADAANYTATRAAKLDGIGADVNVSAASLSALRQEGLSTMFYQRK